MATRRSRGLGGPRGLGIERGLTLLRLREMAGRRALKIGRALKVRGEREVVEGYWPCGTEVLAVLLLLHGEEGLPARRAVEDVLEAGSVGGDRGRPLAAGPGKQGPKPPDRSRLLQQMQQAAAIDRLRHLETHEIEQRRHQVDGADRRTTTSGEPDPGGQADQERDRDQLAIDSVAVPEGSPLAQGLSMVRREDEDRALEHAALTERLHEPAHLLVGMAEVALVEATEMLQVGRADGVLAAVRPARGLAAKHAAVVGVEPAVVVRRRGACASFNEAGRRRCL